MEGINKFSSFGEDEEDLAALRMAALQSIKKKSQESLSPHENVGHFSPCGPKSKRGKFQRPQQGRIPRNNQFNTWNRNSNLISVPMVSSEPNESSPKPETKDSVPKLILPQHRYCKPDLPDDDKCDNAAASKFDRYNDSDQSESDSDEENEGRWKQSAEPIKRSNSLEDLMAELENEIQGGEATKEEKIAKMASNKLKKKRKLSSDTSEEHPKLETALKENLQPQPTAEKQVEQAVEQAPARKMPQKNSFSPRKWQNKAPPPRARHNPGANFMPPQLPLLAPPIEVIRPPFPVQTFLPPPFNGYPSNIYQQPMPMIYDNVPPVLHQVPPAVYDRPLSPLAIKTDFKGATLGPLSPRSAAFVLENRAIIEKRKRRSYSRSPSPRFNSKSPKRFSLSPRRSSKSPPSKRRSLSPSPVRKVLAPRASGRKTIHERLGTKSRKLSDGEDKLVDAKKDTAVDPVLEARRRKFERNEISMKEGVIRLNKSKEEENKSEKEEEQVDKDENMQEAANKSDDDDELDQLLLDCDDTIVLDHKIDALFSDDESDSDNEGRFKTKDKTTAAAAASRTTSTSEKVAVLPFSQLVNGSKKGKIAVDSNRKVDEKKSERRKRYRSRSPPTNKKVSASKSEKKQLKDDKKIEIKIRNPAKYERKLDKEEKINGGRKVEISKTPLKSAVDEDDKKDVVEIVEDLPAQNSNEGDLRAQLSRKRAERQKHPAPEAVPSRLLQNALQSVGVRKQTKIKDETILVEGKLPIHLRLGSANNGSITTIAADKKVRKHKSKGNLEQV